MRIAIFAHHHAELMSGGAERAAYSLFEEINRSSEHEAFLIAFARADKIGHDGNFGAFRARKNEILWAPPGMNHMTHMSLDHARIRRDLKAIFDYVKPDVAHFHHFVNFGLDAFSAIKEDFNIPVVLTLHEYIAICLNDGQMVKTNSMKLCNEASPSECSACFPDISSGKMFLREKVIKKQLSYVDHFISPSDFLRDRYVDWGLPEEKFSVIENILPQNLIAVAETSSAPRRTDFSKKGSKLRLGYFGQITPYKGAPVLLNAIEALSPSYRRRVELVIFGANLEVQKDGFKDNFVSQVERLGPSCIFNGSYRNEDVVHLMRSVDWVVIPSLWWENSPLVIQEAKLAQVPVLGSNIGGMKEKIIDGETGKHFTCGSVLDLSSKIEEIINDEFQCNSWPQQNNNPDLLSRHYSIYNQ